MTEIKDNYASTDAMGILEKDIESLKVHTKKLTDWLLKDIQASIDGLSIQSEMNRSIIEFVKAHQECLERMERDIASWKLFSFAMTIPQGVPLSCRRRCRKDPRLCLRRPLPRAAGLSAFR